MGLLPAAQAEGRESCENRYGEACSDFNVLCVDAAAAAAVVPAETAALPGGSAAQREVFKKSQQKQREAAVWRQTASCICANYALFWRREGAEFPVTSTTGNVTALLFMQKNTYFCNAMVCNLTTFKLLS